MRWSGGLYKLLCIQLMAFGVFGALGLPSWGKGKNPSVADRLKACLEELRVRGVPAQEIEDLSAGDPPKLAAQDLLQQCEMKKTITPPKVIDPVATPPCADCDAAAKAEAGKVAAQPAPAVEKAAESRLTSVERAESVPSPTDAEPAQPSPTPPRSVQPQSAPEPQGPPTLWDARYAAIEAALGSQDEACRREFQTQGIFSKTSEVDAICAASKKVGQRMDVELWPAAHEVAAGAYRFKIGCRARCFCGTKPECPFYPEATYRGEVPKKKDSCSADAAAVAADRAFYQGSNAQEQSGGRYGLAAKACLLQAPVPDKIQSNRSCKTEGGRWNGKGRSFSMLGDASCQWLGFSCTYNCSCKTGFCHAETDPAGTGAGSRSGVAGGAAGGGEDSRAVAGDGDLPAETFPSNQFYLIPGGPVPQSIAQIQQTPVSGPSTAVVPRPGTAQSVPGAVASNAERPSGDVSPKNGGGANSVSPPPQQISPDSPPVPEAETIAQGGTLSPGNRAGEGQLPSDSARGGSGGSGGGPSQTTASRALQFISPFQNRACTHVGGNVFGCMPTPEGIDMKGTHYAHNGVDIPAPAGTEVVTPVEGCQRVPEKGNDVGSTEIILRCGDTIFSYGHIDPDTRTSKTGPFPKGTAVARLISKEKNDRLPHASKMTGPHLHFTVMEVEKEDLEGKTVTAKPINPKNEIQYKGLCQSGVVRGEGQGDCSKVEGGWDNKSFQPRTYRL